MAETSRGKISGIHAALAATHATGVAEEGRAVRVDRAQGGPEVTRRRPVVATALLALLVTAACGSGAAPSPGRATTTPAQLLAPFQGAFTSVALPAGIQSLRDVDCPSAGRCWAVGTTLGTAKSPAAAAVLTTTTGGATWMVQQIPATVSYLTGIACPTTRSCTAVGQVGTGGTGSGAVVTTGNAGATWTLQSVPGGTADVTAVACPSAGTCSVLANLAGRVTALAPGAPGAPWVARGALPATVASATAMACTDARHCWATTISPVDVGHVGGAVAATADGGVTWALQTVPSGTGALEGIDCTAPVSAGTSTSAPGSATAHVGCTAVGTTATATGAPRTGQGLVLTTASGGATWAQASVTATSAALLDVSCGAGPCVAVGTTVAGAPQAGLVVLSGSGGAGSSGWRRAAVAGVLLPLTGVSCRSLASCVVVGESVSAHLTVG